QSVASGLPCVPASMLRPAQPAQAAGRGSRLAPSFSVRASRDIATSDCAEEMMDEISINANTPGDQDQPGVAGFRGTQFVAIWADRPTGNIKAQLLGVNGV